MSRCAQGRPPVNSRRKAAANSPPPQRIQSCWDRSAILLVWMRSSIASGIGMCQCASPAVSEAASTASTTSSEPITPATLSPSATTMWPVSVATSRITSGFTSVARTSASPRISRPSASVLSTSTVVPPYIVSTSPGRTDEPDTMFSAIGTNVLTLTGSLSRAIAQRRLDDGGGAGHVGLHLVHRGRRLDGEAAGVEGDCPCPPARGGRPAWRGSRSARPAAAARPSRCRRRGCRRSPWRGAASRRSPWH